MVWRRAGPRRRRAGGRGPGPALLALEAFAEHFLEDMFAAGHVAGSWGNAAERKGTHDFYNQHGSRGPQPGAGEETVLFGDGFLKPDVRPRSPGRRDQPRPVRRRRTDRARRPARRRLKASVPGRRSYGTFDVCRSAKMPAGTSPDSLDPPGSRRALAACRAVSRAPGRARCRGSTPRSGPFAARGQRGAAAPARARGSTPDIGGQLSDCWTLGCASVSGSRRSYGQRRRPRLLEGRRQP